MTKQVTITIGIAARNEEKTIRQSLHTAIASLRQCDPAYTPQIIVALNGCVDHTEDRVREVMEEMRTDPTAIPISITHSQEGLIHAQRAIAVARRPGDIIVFLDADLLIDQHCVAALVDAMQDPSVQVAWAQVIPSDVARPRYKHLVYNFADYYPSVMTDRVYFSGRAFAVRAYDVPFTSVDLKTIDPKLAAFLRLEAGPIIDDVFLSRAIIHQYGPSAIKYVSAAKVYFQPIASLRDFYYSQRRAMFERKRLNLLFPEHSYIVRKYYKRTLRKEVYAALPFRSKMTYHLYGFLYKTIRRISLVQYLVYSWVLKLGWRLPSHKIWPALKTTKKAFKNETTN
jgi:glycosyltransferase involved in cell wall biosynthesis